MCAAHERDDVRAQLGRVAQPARAPATAATRPARVRGRRPRAPASGLPRSWKSAASRTASGVPASAAAWTTANVCSSSGQVWWSLSCSKPIAGSNSGSSCDEHARVAREPQRLGRMRAEQQLRQLAHPVGREPAADPLARDELDRGASSRICCSVVVVRVEVELRDEAQPAHEAQRILGEAVRARSCGARRRSRSSRPPNGSTSSPSASRARHRVDREVAPREVLLDESPRRRRSRSRAGPARSSARARRRELDPGRRERAEPRSRGRAARRRAGRRRRAPRPARAARARPAARRCRRPGRGSPRPSTRARAARRGPRRRRGTRRGRASGRSPRPVHAPPSD